MYPIIHIFGRDIGTYALAAFVGLFAAAVFVFFKTKKIGVASEDIVILTLIVAGSTVVGGHLLFAATQAGAVANAFRLLFSGEPFSAVINALAAAFGGSVFYGGLIFSLIAVFIAVRKKNPLEKAVIFDAYAAAIPLFHAFGRIGCFLGGCCYGVESDFGFVVTDNPLVPELCGVRRFPVALAEAVFNLLIFGLLLLLSRKKRFGGRLIFYYGLMYSVVRFCLEFLRGDVIRGIYFGLSTSQWISIAIFVICSACILRRVRIGASEE